MSPSARRTLQRVAIALVAALLIAGGALWLRVRGRASVGAGYVAHQLCSCLYVAGRSLESCRADLMDAVKPIAVDWQREQHAVRAFIPGLVERRAHEVPGTGCTLD